MKDALIAQQIVASLVRIFTTYIPEGEYAVPFIEMTHDYLGKVFVMIAHENAQWNHIEKLLEKKHENFQNTLIITLPLPEIKELIHQLFLARKEAENFKAFSQSILSLSQSILDRLRDAAQAPAPIIDELRKTCAMNVLTNWPGLIENNTESTFNLHIYTPGAVRWETPGGILGYLAAGWLPPESFIRDIMENDILYTSSCSYFGVGGFMSLSVPNSVLTLAKGNKEQLPYKMQSTPSFQSKLIVTPPNTANWLQPLFSIFTRFRTVLSPVTTLESELYGEISRALIPLLQIPVKKKDCCFIKKVITLPSAYENQLFINNVELVAKIAHEYCMEISSHYKDTNKISSIFYPIFGPDYYIKINFEKQHDDTCKTNVSVCRRTKSLSTGFHFRMIADNGEEALVDAHGGESSVMAAVGNLTKTGRIIYQNQDVSNVFYARIKCLLFSPLYDSSLTRIHLGTGSYQEKCIPDSAYFETDYLPLESWYEPFKAEPVFNLQLQQQLSELIPGSEVRFLPKFQESDTLQFTFKKHRGKLFVRRMNDLINNAPKNCNYRLDRMLINQDNIYPNGHDDSFFVLPQRTLEYVLSTNEDYRHRLETIEDIAIALGEEYRIISHVEKRAWLQLTFKSRIDMLVWAEKLVKEDILNPWQIHDAIDRSLSIHGGINQAALLNLLHRMNSEPSQSALVVGSSSQSHFSEPGKMLLNPTSLSDNFRTLLGDSLFAYSQIEEHHSGFNIKFNCSNWEKTKKFMLSNALIRLNRMTDTTLTNSAEGNVILTCENTKSFLAALSRKKNLCSGLKKCFQIVSAYSHSSGADSMAVVIYEASRAKTRLAFGTRTSCTVSLGNQGQRFFTQSMNTLIMEAYYKRDKNELLRLLGQQAVTYDLLSAIAENNNRELLDFLLANKALDANAIITIPPKYGYSYKSRQYTILAFFIDREKPNLVSVLRTHGVELVPSHPNRAGYHGPLETVLNHFFRREEEFYFALCMDILAELGRLKAANKDISSELKKAAGKLHISSINTSMLPIIEEFIRLGPPFEKEIMSELLTSSSL